MPSDKTPDLPCVILSFTPANRMGFSLAEWLEFRRNWRVLGSIGCRPEAKAASDSSGQATDRRHPAPLGGRILPFVLALGLAALGSCASPEPEHQQRQGPPGQAFGGFGTEAGQAGQGPMAFGGAGGGSPPGGTPPGPAGGGFGPPPGGGKEDPGSYANLLTADAWDASYSSTKDQENALRIQDGLKVSLKQATIKKTAGAAAQGEASNFYGANAAVLVRTKAQASISDSTVDSSTRGANGIFSHGSGTGVTVANTVIRTSGDSSGGVMVAGGGSMTVNNCDIETKGASSAALRSDRGGGLLKVNGGNYLSHGMGSPAIYSTADIRVSNATLEATASEAVVVEGQNSVSLKDCRVIGRMQRDRVENIHNVMIYQSMSGDAPMGQASFAMTGGSLESKAGDMFYVTNTSCTITLEAVDMKLANPWLLSVLGNDARTQWGQKGKNGGVCEFIARNQSLGGDIRVDSISRLKLTLAGSTSYTGAINPGNEGGRVDLTLEAGSTWTLGADSNISSLAGDTSGIKLNGYRLTLGGKAYQPAN